MAKMVVHTLRSIHHENYQSLMHGARDPLDWRLHSRPYWTSRQSRHLNGLDISSSRRSSRKNLFKEWFVDPLGKQNFARWYDRQMVRWIAVIMQQRYILFHCQVDVFGVVNFGKLFGVVRHWSRGLHVCTGLHRKMTQPWKWHIIYTRRLKMLSWLPILATCIDKQPPSPARLYYFSITAVDKWPNKERSDWLTGGRFIPFVALETDEVFVRSPPNAWTDKKSLTTDFRSRIFPLL